MTEEMEYPTLEERLAFLGLSPSLPSITPRSKPRGLANAPRSYVGQNRAFISGGTVASFVRSVSDDDEQDVLDCDTYLQQYADEQYNRETQWYEWLQHYTQGFWHLGWIHQRTTMLQSKREILFEPISDTVLKTLAPMVDDPAYEAAREAFEALKSNAKASALLAEKSGSERGRQFLTLPCTYDAKGRLTSSLIHSWYKATVSPEQFLFFKWTNHETLLAQHYGTFTLDRERFGQIKQAMLDKMAERSRRYIERL